MSEKYIELRQAIFRDLRDRGRPIAVSIGDVLEWLDEHPDQVPGRTITESEFKHAARRNQMGDSFGCYEGFLDDLGITVVPDPEPTNAEKLVQLLKDVVPGSGGGISWESAAQKLDEAGVKVTTNQEES